MKKSIKIACTGAGTLAIHLMTPIQDDLKILTEEKLKLLKAEILEDGFSFPIAIWENPETSELCILDGTQRHRALTSLKEDGYQVPEVPIVMVSADSLDQAKHKLLAAASQYGKISEDGVMLFIANVDQDFQKFVKTLSLDVDMENVFNHVFTEPQTKDKEFLVDVVSHKRNLNADTREPLEIHKGDMFWLGDHQLICGEDKDTAMKLIKFWEKSQKEPVQFIRNSPKTILRSPLI